MALARGLELAVYQPVVDFPSLIAATGISFVLVKASEAAGRDPLFQQHWAAARQAGLLRGAYHFLRQATDPQQQVDNFLGALAGDPGELPPALDIEDPRFTNPAQYAAGAKLWLNQVEAALHRRPMIYTAGWWWNPGMFINGRYPDWAPGYRLWVASWPMKKSVPTVAQLEQGQFKPILPKSWTGWQFWQYSGDAATVPGITNINGLPATVDLDVFNGSVDDLRALSASLGSAVPAEHPADPLGGPHGIIRAVGFPLPDPRVTNQVMINAYSRAFGVGFFDIITRCGLAGMADQRPAVYSGPAIEAITGLDALGHASLTEALLAIVGG
jgi:lysozyme